MFFILQIYAIFSSLFGFGQQFLYNPDENNWEIYVGNGITVNLICPQTTPEDHVQLFIDDHYELELSDRVSYHPTSGFKIKQFTNRDIGLYKCTIEKNGITRTFRNFDIHVLKNSRPIDVPEIDEYKLRHVFEGANLSVNCTAQVSNAAVTVISWIGPNKGYDNRISIKRYRENESGKTIKTAELKIQNVSSNDAGQYRCRLGRGRANWFNEVATVLTVNEPLPSQTVPEEHIKLVIHSGTTATLLCPETSVGDEIRLFINGDYEMEESDRLYYDPELGFEIENVTRMDSGIYKCIIEEDRHIKMIKTFHVQVLSPPRVCAQPEIDEYKLRHVVEGQIVRVNCTVEFVYDESTLLYWIPPQRNDDRISTKIYKIYEPNITVVSAELTIESVSSKDEGEYKCRLRRGETNRFNDVTTILTVMKLPTFQDEAVKDSKLVYIQHGNTATLACPKTSPDDHIRLFIDDDYEVESDRLSFNSTFGFEMKNITIMDTGIYKCTIEKDNKTRTMETFDVKVLRGPRPIDEPEIDLFKLRHVIDGEYLRVNCSARVSNTEMTSISWIGPNNETNDRISTKKYRVVESGETIKVAELRIHNVSSNDAGEYRCRLGRHGVAWIKEVATMLTIIAKPAESSNP